MIRLAPLAWLLVVVSAVAGCASGAPAARTLQITDAKSLSGTWLGFATGTGAGAPNPIELTIHPDGTWTSRTGANAQGGTLSLKDGRAVFTRTGATGGSSTVPQASTAELQDRGGVRVLVGQGRSDYGPYSYEFTERK
jgi:hypothetical protein